jgi:hypothetical protein
MKKIIFCFIALIFFSCKKTDLNQFKNQSKIDSSNEVDDKNIEVLLKIPLGEKKLIDYNFPKEWNNLDEIDDTNPEFSIDKISKKGYDSIFYFIEKNTDEYYSSIKENKNKTITIPSKETGVLLKLYDGSIVLDSVYYVETISTMSNYSIELYKSGDKYKPFLVGGNEKSTFNYLCLATFSKNHSLIDSKIIYYNNYDDVQSYKRFFYINKDLKIYLKDFSVDELTTKNIENNYFNILSDGTFKKGKND